MPDYTKMRKGKHANFVIDVCPKCGRKGQVWEGTHHIQYHHKSEMNGIGGGELVTEHCIIRKEIS